MRNAQQVIREATSEVRRLVDALRPPALDELGLVLALRNQADQFNVASSIADATFEVQAPDSIGPLPAAVELAAYRIATEAMTNVHRHSRAGRCTVRVARGENLDVEVVDDGCGIPPDAPSGVGLASMRERAAALGGTLSVESREGMGTSVVARLPLA